MSSLESVPAVASFVVPIPRTSAVAEVWAEFGSVLGIPDDEADGILKRGIQNFLIERATFSFLNSKDLVLFEVRLAMDWKKHQLAVEHQANMSLSPGQPLTLQLHDGFAQLFTYVHMVRRREGASRVEFTIGFRPEICEDQNLLARAREFLGVGPVAARKYALGQLQPDLQFRLGALSETTVTIRENWT